MSATAINCHLRYLIENKDGTRLNAQETETQIENVLPTEAIPVPEDVYITVKINADDPIINTTDLKTELDNITEFITIKFLSAIFDNKLELTIDLADYLKNKKDFEEGGSHDKRNEAEVT